MLLHKVDPCPDLTMGKFACKNKSQCWEPCGDLGHSEEHAVISVIQSPYIGSTKKEPEAKTRRVILEGTTAYISKELDDYGS